MQSPIKQGVINKCQEDIDKFNKASRLNYDYADIWGKIHLFLGISATISSALSTAFTFADDTYKFYVIALSISAAVFAGTLTFLNPSQREADRQDTARNCLLYVSDVEAFLVRIDSYRNEVEILNNHTVLVKRKAELIQKMKYRL